MIGATERAKQELKRILNANTDKPEACLRLTSNDQGQLGLAHRQGKTGGQSDRT